MRCTANPLALSLAAALVAGCSSPAGTGEAPAQRRSVTGLSFEAPEGWVEEEAASRMRAAQFRLPPREEDGEPARLVLYHFGEAGAGTVDENLDRWLGQFEVPGAASPREAATIVHGEEHGLDLHRVEVSGTYVAETRPGSGERVHEPDTRMLAAIVETEAGPYYAKLVGPEATVERWERSFDAFLHSLRPAPVGEMDGAPHP